MSEAGEGFNKNTASEIHSHSFDWLGTWEESRQTHHQFKRSQQNSAKKSLTS